MLAPAQCESLIWRCVCYTLAFPCLSAVPISPLRLLSDWQDEERKRHYLRHICYTSTGLPCCVEFRRVNQVLNCHSSSFTGLIPQHFPDVHGHRGTSSSLATPTTFCSTTRCPKLCCTVLFALPSRLVTRLFLYVSYTALHMSFATSGCYRPFA